MRLFFPFFPWLLLPATLLPALLSTTYISFVPARHPEQMPRHSSDPTTTLTTTGGARRNGNESLAGEEPTIRPHLPYSPFIYAFSYYFACIISWISRIIVGRQEASEPCLPHIGIPPSDLLRICSSSCITSIGKRFVCGKVAMLCEIGYPFE